MKKYSLISILSVLFVSAFAFSANAQASTDWLTNTMFSSGKINVVVAVVAAVFILLVIYLFSIDRRLSKMEKNQTNELK